MGPEELGRGWGGEGGVMELLLPLAGVLVPLLLLAGVALVTILLLRRAKLATPTAGSAAHPALRATDPALATLRDRYARGELDTAEYEERRHRLLDEAASL